jgi:hypothetical protein
MQHNLKPILAGRLSDAPPGSDLRLRYRAPGWIYIFYLFWYLMFIRLAILSVGGFDAEATNSDKVTGVVVLAFFFVWPPILHAFVTMRSDEELSKILDFLAEHAEAVPDPRP